MTPESVNSTDERIDDSLACILRKFTNRVIHSGAKNLHPLVIQAVEKLLITQVLTTMQWNQMQAARILGMNRNTLRKKIRTLQISRSAFADHTKLRRETAMQVAKESR